MDNHLCHKATCAVVRVAVCKNYTTPLQTIDFRQQAFLAAQIVFLFDVHNNIQTSVFTGNQNSFDNRK